MNQADSSLNIAATYLFLTSSCNINLHPDFVGAGIQLGAGIMMLPDCHGKLWSPTILTHALLSVFV